MLVAANCQKEQPAGTTPLKAWTPGGGTFEKDIATGGWDNSNEFAKSLAIF
jgi:hypothetical protein